MKLYPPILERTIPAFYTDSEGTVITVPFSMNRATDLKDVKGFQLKIRAIQSNSNDSLGTVTSYEKPAYNIDTKNYSVNFIIPDEMLGDSEIVTQKEKFFIGNFYKLQMAYINNDNELGYFSTVSIVKYTTKPNIYIENLSHNDLNNHSYNYIGIYSQKNMDVTEKAYQYRFILTDYNDQIIDDTGLLLCDNINNQETYQCKFYYSYMSDIPDGYIPDTFIKKYYILQLIVYTNNKLIVSSSSYKLIKQELQLPTYDTPIISKLNFDNGYVSILIEGPINQETQLEEKLLKEYLISRACEDSNFLEWEEIYKIRLNNEYISKQTPIDFTVEQGKSYVYSIQEKMYDGSYSNRILSNTIQVDFEDVFIYDGEKQLKIKYNPKIGSFKINNAETKTDTIGSKFPVFFRNSHIKYKEISIGGLISYLSDEQELFMTNEELSIENMPNIQVIEGGYRELQGLPLLEKVKELSKVEKYDYIKIEDPLEGRVRTVNLEDYSISAERIFKNKVINWLSNGKVKLFRSPTEGNFLIYLTNVSLTPEDRIGRLVHSFQATAYEISDYNYKDLIQHNIYRHLTVTEWVSLPLSSSSQPIDYLKGGIPDDRYYQDNQIWYLRGSIIPTNIIATSISFSGVNPGATFNIRFKTNEVQTITIGATGNYELEPEYKIYTVQIPNDAQYTGIITYTYNKE